MATGVLDQVAYQTVQPIGIPEDCDGRDAADVDFEAGTSDGRCDPSGELIEIDKLVPPGGPPLVVRGKDQQVGNQALHPVELLTDIGCRAQA